MDDKLQYLINELKQELEEEKMLENKIKNNDYNLDSILPFETNDLNYENSYKRKQGKFLIKILEHNKIKLSRYNTLFLEYTDFGYDLFFTYKEVYYRYSIMQGQGTEEGITIVDKKYNDYYMDLRKQKVVNSNGNKITTITKIKTYIKILHKVKKG
ncbi:hypothetical protein TwortDSMZ_058 [Staphylococcus phage Twort]|uniref:ORF078 n=2 Tax=Staphylococcus phage Twort (strain DSM 17442 / HER 48) TaxID=2908167 RepID=Q4Z901_BPTWO|nr:ORF078 [Staphylococcus phage Twort]AAX92372.1 ORF078 [Staphylococcus phage Twort]QIW89063.1 hypothetical protein TwortDSMZ_058 [Staphylococcus phage Twort]